MKSFAIIPAAGESRRVGQPKLLLPWGETTIIGATLAAWQASAAQNIVVVLRAADTALQKEVRKFRVNVCEIPQPTRDMKATLQAGVDWTLANFACRETDVWLTAPADIPMLTFTAIDQVITAYDPAARLPVVARINGRSAHPVLLPFGLANLESQCAPHEGLRDLLARASVAFVNLPSETHQQSINTMEDYERCRPKTEQD